MLSLAATCSRPSSLLHKVQIGRCKFRTSKSGLHSTVIRHQFKSCKLIRSTRKGVRLRRPLLDCKYSRARFQPTTLPRS
jgi:hypothetical protein